MSESGSLQHKTISALFYSFGGFLANSGVQFGIMIILARLVSPAEFGILGMVTIFTAISQIFIDSGMTQALIREKNVTQEDYSTVFYYNLLVAIVMYSILFALAGSISKYFREPQLIAIIRVISVGMIISALGIIQRTMLVRNIDFKSQTRIDVTSSILSGIVAITMAYAGFGVWSLVLRTLVQQLATLIMLTASNKWLPSPAFNRRSFDRLFGFGWKMLLTGLLATVYNYIYNIIIGRSYSATQLGYYAKSLQLRDVVSNSITTSVSKVSYPVLSSIQDDTDRLELGFKKIIRSASFLTFPVMIGLVAIAHPMVQLMFGDQWVPMVPYLQILCLAGATFPHRAINLNVLLVKGRSDLFLRLDVIKIVIGLCLIGLAIFLGFGIYGLLWVNFILAQIAFWINSYYSREFISYSTMEQVRDMVPSLVASGAMGAVLYLSGFFLPQSSFVRLTLQVIIGATTYILLSKLTGIKELDTVLGLVRSLSQKPRDRRDPVQ